MIDFETDLRDRLDRATAEVAAPPDLLPTIERRITTRARRTTALRIAGAVAVVTLAAGVALVATGGDGDDGTAPIATAPTTTTAPPLASGWSPMADAPIAPRSEHLVLAMGDEVLVSGGRAIADASFVSDGAVYEPATDTWRAIPDAPLPSTGVGVWTGTEAIVVSGGPPQTAEDDAGGPPAAAAFDPATDTWRTLAAPPAELAPHGISVVWTGTHVVAVRGGTSVGDGAPTVVALYDPATDTWASGASTDHLSGDAAAVWTGSEVLLVTNADTDPATDAFDETVVRAYDPESDTWRSIPWGLKPGSRIIPAVAWTGDRLFVGGGLTFGADPEGEARAGALLDPATGVWTPVAAAPTGIFGPEKGVAIWTGERVLVRTVSGDGHPQTGQTPDGFAAYDPVTDMWTEGPDRPQERGVQYAGWAWSAGRVVVPLGVTPEPIPDDGSIPCCTTGPPGGATYVP